MTRQAHKTVSHLESDLWTQKDLSSKSKLLSYNESEHDAHYFGWK